MNYVRSKKIMYEFCMAFLQPQKICSKNEQKLKNFENHTKFQTVVFLNLYWYYELCMNYVCFIDMFNFDVSLTGGRQYSKIMIFKNVRKTKIFPGLFFQQIDARELCMNYVWSKNAPVDLKKFLWMGAKHENFEKILLFFWSLFSSYLCIWIMYELCMVRKHSVLAK